MEKEFENGIFIGYKIGKFISVHTHISDPESWFVTIWKLKIFSETLCKKDCTEAEIARYVHLLLNDKRNTVYDVIKDVVPFT